MSDPRLFLDASALFTGVASESGAARSLLLLSEKGLVRIIVSEQIVTETERNVARKAPRALSYLRNTLRGSGMQIVKNPTADEVEQHHDIIAHETDIPVVVAAMKVAPDLLVTHNRKHFLDDPAVAQRSGLHIVTPGEALAWVRERLTPTD